MTPAPNSSTTGLGAKLVNVVGDRTAKVLDTVFGYKTVSDLLHHYPRRYLVRGELSNIAELQEGDEVTILAEVFSSTNRRLAQRKGSTMKCYWTINGCCGANGNVFVITNFTNGETLTAHA